MTCWFVGLWFERYFACRPARLMIWLVGSIWQKDKHIEIQKQKTRQERQKLPKKSKNINADMFGNTQKIIQKHVTNHEKIMKNLSQIGQKIL